MADKKISQLTGASTPLAGTEVLPIVQGGSTVKVSVDNLTTGKAVTVGSLSSSGAVTVGSLSSSGAVTVGSLSSSGAVSGTTLTATGNVNLDGGTFVFNESGANKDFRIEGDAEAHLFYTKASTDQIGLNTSAPIRLLTLGGGKDMLFLNTAGDGATNTVLGRVSSNVRTYGGNIGTASFASIEFATDATDWFKGELRFLTNGTDGTDALQAVRMRITAQGNIVAGASAALATTATNGFLYVPTCAGTPTGTPTTITGMAPIVVNTTNNKLYFYSGGAWRDAGP